jgi:hypothetical protein
MEGTLQLSIDERSGCRSLLQRGERGSWHGLGMKGAVKGGCLERSVLVVHLMLELFKVWPQDV